MEELYDEALDEISEKAQLLGANAVLGLRIDMDNISGKGMSMFMITATGTAASIEFSSGKRVDNNGPVSYNPYDVDDFRKNYEQFIQTADHSLAIEPRYEAIYHEATLNDACGLIKRHQLFDAKSILTQSRPCFYLISCPRMLYFFPSLMMITWPFSNTF